MPEWIYNFMIGTWVFWKVAWERLVDSGSYFNKVRGVLWKLSCERGRWMVGHISMKSRGFYETISKRGLWMAGWFPWSPGSLLQNSQISSRRSLPFARDLTAAVFLADVDAVPSRERDQVSVLKRFLARTLFPWTKWTTSIYMTARTVLPGGGGTVEAH